MFFRYPSVTLYLAVRPTWTDGCSPATRLLPWTTSLLWAPRTTWSWGWWAARHREGRSSLLLGEGNIKVLISWIYYPLNFCSYKMKIFKFQYLLKVSWLFSFLTLVIWIFKLTEFIISEGYPEGYPYDVTVSRLENEGFGFVIISSVSRAGSTIGRIIPGITFAIIGRILQAS